MKNETNQQNNNDSQMGYDTILPGVLLDNEGYPTERYLNFIKNYTHKTMPILCFIDILRDGWHFGDWGYKLHRKYAGKRKFELHTGGWSGNEDIVSAIISNIWLTHFQMRFVRWETGGHYYFEIAC
jgi:hypothetical protein